MRRAMDGAVANTPASMNLFGNFFTDITSTEGKFEVAPWITFFADLKLGQTTIFRMELSATYLMVRRVPDL